MSHLNTFLKVLQKVGYPNPSVPTYAKITDYDLDDLFQDLVDEVGVEKADDFVSKALQSLSDGDKGIFVNLDEVNATGAYAHLIIHESRIDFDESNDAAMITWSWGDSRIATVDENGQDEWKTIQEAWQDVDMGDWGDFDSFIDEIKEVLNKKVYENCGFNLWFENET
jgi:hypothetical protein